MSIIQTEPPRTNGLHFEPVNIHQAIGPHTTAIRGGLAPDPTTGAITTPVFQSTTYAQDAVGCDKGFTYSRSGNPTVAALERQLGAIENAKPAVVFSTGLAAITALFLSELKAGDTVVVSDVVYGGTVRLLRQILANFNVNAVFVNTSDSIGRLRETVKQTRAKLLFIETPANPTLKLTDIEAVCDVARECGVRSAVDNTFLTAALQRPLDLGADVCVYSTTKYIEGHNATVGGALVSRDAERVEKYKLAQNTLGAIQSPWDAWLTIRGLKTLPYRIRQHSSHALAIARWLEADDRVERVDYPGLDSFPQRELARKQHAGDAHGGIIAFEVRGGERAGVALMNNVKLCYLAENLGALETLITHPASMTHGSYEPDARRAVGITDGLVRVSVGLEDPADIIADLDQALAIAVAARD